MLSLGLEPVTLLHKAQPKQLVTVGQKPEGWVKKAARVEQHRWQLGCAQRHQMPLSAGSPHQWMWSMALWEAF